MNTTKPSRLSILAFLLGFTLLAGESLGQFVPGGGTLVRERVAGVLQLSSDAPVPVDGDQIAAFYNGQIVSEVFQFTVESGVARVLGGCVRG